jgi:membrane fusion protein (multidrug efflux system)
MMARSRFAWSPSVAFLALVAAFPLLISCGSRSSAPPAPGPVEVGVVTITPAPVALTRELPGRTSATR